eukprot:2413821-Karenia_brevis.AAC.1
MTQRWNHQGPELPPPVDHAHRQLLPIPPVPPEPTSTSNTEARHTQARYGFMVHVVERYNDQAREVQLEAKASQVAAAIAATTLPTVTPSPSPERLPVPAMSTVPKIES